ncbi:hypothetical protein CAP35_07930 [Chitinophagaceae bacterium IBVUCB1]|nr:hypothetical protein CAP35_07930 [Chitinophagaceae bacterium IBVUCB1]
MKKYLHLLIFCLTILTTNGTRAQNLAGGEITYEWIADSTYRVIFKSYFECVGIAEPNTMSLCITNTCSTAVLTSTLSKTSAVNLPPSCPAYPTKCTQTSSSIPGYKEVLYSALITLPYRCNAWKFGVSYVNRAISVNVSSSIFYTSTTFNNLGMFQGNSSPYFINKPIAYACSANPYNYNSVAVDPNGDSLVTDLVNVQTATNCTTAISAALNTSSPALSIPSNPFQTNNTTTISSPTGNMGFTPATLGENVCALRVREFRNGILIGSVIREMRFVVLPCSTSSSITTSPFVALTNCVASTWGVTVCPGTSFGFGFDIKSTNPATKIVVSDNHMFTTPGATVSYSGQYTDSIRVNYNWFWPLGSPMFRTLIFTIKDSSCLSPGIVINRSFAMQISPFGVAITMPDTFVCQGQSVMLSGGNNWSIVSGPPGSLSCTTCTNPVATPTTKTTYMSFVPACPNFTDSITIDVKPVTAPTLSLTANTGVSIKAGDTVTFTANTTNCTNKQYIWKKNGTTTAGVTSNTYTTSFLANADVISCQLICNDSCPNPKTQTQQLTMIVAAGIGSVNYTDNITISPNPSYDGIFSIKTNTTLNNVNIIVINSMGQTVYTERALSISSGNTKPLNLQHLPAGIYTIRLNDMQYKVSISK